MGIHLKNFIKYIKLFSFRQTNIKSQFVSISALQYTLGYIEMFQQKFTLNNKFSWFIYGHRANLISNNAYNTTVKQSRNYLVLEVGFLQCIGAWKVTGNPLEWLLLLVFMNAKFGNSFSSPFGISFFEWKKKLKMEKIHTKKLAAYITNT